jgi:DNA sulfur modification protein DndE
MVPCYSFQKTECNTLLSKPHGRVRWLTDVRRLVSARNQSNIGLTGEGTIDGAGHVWKSVKSSKLTESQWKSLIKTGVNDGNTWYPTAASKIGHESDWAKKITAGKTFQDYESVRDFLRPNMVSFINCDVVLIDGPVFNNSPAWTLHPLMCRHTSVKNTTVINPWYGQNNDAIDLESCRFGILIIVPLILVMMRSL